MRLWISSHFLVATFLGGVSNFSISERALLKPIVGCEGCLLGPPRAGRVCCRCPWAPGHRHDPAARSGRTALGAEPQPLQREPRLRAGPAGGSAAPGSRAGPSRAEPCPGTRPGAPLGGDFSVAALQAALNRAAAPAMCPSGVFLGGV